jgi:hypothetical protein
MGALARPLIAVSGDFASSDPIVRTLDPAIKKGSRKGPFSVYFSLPDWPALYAQDVTKDITHRQQFIR